MSRRARILCSGFATIASSEKGTPMSTVPTHALRQLRAGKLAIGLGVAQARTVGIATIAKTAGFDWLFIDGEHSSLDADTAAQIATASDRKSTRLNSSHSQISYAVFCLKKTIK